MLLRVLGPHPILEEAMNIGFRRQCLHVEGVSVTQSNGTLWVSETADCLQANQPKPEANSQLRDALQTQYLMH